MSLMAVSGIAQKRKLERLPYIDQRRIHFGFSVGLHTQDLGFTHTGYTTEAGDTWYAEVPSFSPGFNVGLVSDLYLCKYLNLRFCPTMYFGNKTVEFREDHTDERRTVDLKSNYIMIPVDIKYSAKRLNNYCPYITAGVAGAFDISKKKAINALKRHINHTLPWINPLHLTEPCSDTLRKEAPLKIP